MLTLMIYLNAINNRFLGPPVETLIQHVSYSLNIKKA